MTRPEASTPAAAAAGSKPPASGGVRLWMGRLAALTVVVLFGWGSLLLADWLRERGDLGRPVPPPYSPERARAEAVTRDPRLEPWLDPAIGWGPARRTAFGRDAAIVITGSSPDGPELVFERRLLSYAKGLGGEALAQSLREGPSVARAFRLNATLSAGPVCASLVRLPLDVEASRGKTLKTEAGVVLLGFRAHHRWDYVTFWFPRGLDLSAMTKESAPPRRILAGLGPVAESALVPTLALGGEGEVKGSKTVLCRSVGPAGAAIDRIAASLLARGWHDVETGLPKRTPGARALTGPTGTVWMATTDVDRRDGLVSVLVEAP